MKQPLPPHCKLLTPKSNKRFQVLIDDSNVERLYYLIWDTCGIVPSNSVCGNYQIRSIFLSNKNNAIQIAKYMNKDWMSKLS